METGNDSVGIAVASLICSLVGLVVALRWQNRQLKAGYQEIIKAEANMHRLYETDRKLNDTHCHELLGFIIECHKMIREKDETITTL